MTPRSPSDRRDGYADGERCNRVAIVTGGTHGIGRSCVEHLAAEGWHVVFQGRDEEAGSMLADSGLGSYVPGDLAREDTIERLVTLAETIGEGRIAGLVNNAGRGGRKPFAESSLADWDDIFAVNARSAFAVTRRALPGLRASSGSVVFVSSVAGLGGEADLSVYCASKAALIGLAKALAVELGEEVRFNTICPGQIATRMMRRITASPELSRPLVNRIPRRRFGEADEVASAVSWLLSDGSSYVNGAVLTVDGGESAGLIAADRPPPVAPSPSGGDSLDRANR